MQAVVDGSFTDFLIHKCPLDGATAFWNNQAVWSESVLALNQQLSLTLRRECDQQ